MKKLLFFGLLIFSLAANSQAYIEGFEGSALPAGWDTLNMSGPTPGTVPAWFPSSNFIAPPAPIEGSSFYSADYQAEGNNGTISSWLFTPVRTLSNGDAFSFYTRTVANNVSYPDRLEVRMSFNGSSINTGTSSATTGDFMNLICTINPNLQMTGYPTTWTKYIINISGVPGGSASGRFAFRYYVTNSGPNGVNGDGIGIDSVYYSPYIITGIANIATISYKLFPNPTTGILNLHFPVSSNQRELIIQNMMGQILYQEKPELITNKVDLSSLPKGIYILSIKENNVVRTEKITLQ